MKYRDIQKIHSVGLITDEQRRKIIEHFRLGEDGGNRFLVIISIIGAVLVTAGIILLVSAHWNGIPHGVKIAIGILLMLGFHAGGWWLRGIQGKYRKTGEALHLIGSGLFLANIALIGQIYNIVSRPPNAFLVWWMGIAAIPWLLRSKAQHLLLLLAFGIWFGLEVNERGSWLYVGHDARQILLYSLLGSVYLGAGWLLRHGTFSEFAGVTEKFGLLGFLVFFYPLTWKHFSRNWENTEMNNWLFPSLGLVALLLLIAGIRNRRALTAQWRWTWLAALFAMMVFMATVWFGCWQPAHHAGPRYLYWSESGNYLAGTLVLFIFCLLQIQIGLQERSPFLVNLGVVFVAFDILAAYFDLLGSMARTGLMFVVSGVFLILLGIYLETKRRKLVLQLKSRPPERSMS